MHRLHRELSGFVVSPPPGIACWLVDDSSVHHLRASIVGPVDTVYEGGIFHLDLVIPHRYPFEPPSCKFLTRIWHPNIDHGGRICLSTLCLPPKGTWAPSLSLSSLLQSIQLLLSEPNPKDGLEREPTQQYLDSPSLFSSTAIEWTTKYAKEKEIQPEILEEKQIDKQTKRTNENEQNEEREEKRRKTAEEENKQN
jgi:ubiquitin-conjugating enzyme E2 T